MEFQRVTSRFFQNRGNSRVEYGVALKYARVGTRRALVTRGPAGFVRVYTTDYLTAEIHTNFAPTCHEHLRLALDGVAPHLVLGHLRILRVRLLSIVYYKKSSAASGNTKRTPARTRRGQLAGTRYPRQANRGTGLGRGDPSAFGY